NCVAVFINQVREKIGVMYGNPETTTGGRALKFYASVRMEVRKGEAIKNGAEVIGNRTRVKIVKNKVAPPFKECEFDMMYGKGISRTGEVLDLATDLDIIHKSGSWFSYGERKLGQGRDAVKEILENEPEFAKEVEQRIMQQKEALVLASKKNKKAAAVSDAKSKADQAVAATGAALDAAGADLDEDFEEFAPEE
ncbi:MAG: DNA recombination/repair protein RecA, partial [Oscillospiraceae bacterium]|nr:DNA recombination/repair protein RecA [Oscillospiraceae bacterium]